VENNQLRLQWLHFIVPSQIFCLFVFHEIKISSKLENGKNSFNSNKILQ